MAYLWDRIVFYIRWPEYAWQVGDNFQEAYAWQESYVYQGVEDTNVLYLWDRGVVDDSS